MYGFFVLIDERWLQKVFHFYGYSYNLDYRQELLDRIQRRYSNSIYPPVIEGNRWFFTFNPEFFKAHPDLSEKREYMSILGIDSLMRCCLAARFGKVEDLHNICDSVVKYHDFRNLKEINKDIYGEKQRILLGKNHPYERIHYLHEGIDLDT